MRIIFVFIIPLLFASTVFAQFEEFVPLHDSLDYYKNYDYGEIEFYASNLAWKDYYTIEEAAEDIAGQYELDHEKAYAIYTWLTSHANYDCKSHKKLLQDLASGTKRKKSSGSRSKLSKGTSYKDRSDSRQTNARQILERRKGNYEDLAGAFASLCIAQGVECQVISGIYKGSERYIDRKQKGNYRWNAVNFGNDWYLVDITRGMVIDDKINDKQNRGMYHLFAHKADDLCKDVEIIEERLNHFYLIDPREMLFSCIPGNRDWQLLVRSYAIDSFYKQPLIRRGFYQYGFNGISPKNGLIKAKEDENITFRFKQKPEFAGVEPQVIHAYKNTKILFENENLTKEGDEYVYTIKTEERGQYYLKFAMDSLPIATYKVVVK